jgi:hypothetical protein
MPTTDPYKPLQGVIKLGTNEIGAALTTTGNLDFKLDVDEHYGLGDAGKPKLVKGNKHFKGKLSKAWIDKTFGELVTAGTQVDVVFYPEGKDTGKPTVTVKNAILHDWSFKMDRSSIVAEDLAFTGDDLVFGTAS